MFCTNCGADNSETAKFCRKCGEPFHAEEETRVAARRPPEIAGRDESERNDEPEKELFSISPTLLFVKIGYALAAIGALLMAALTSVFLSSYVSVWLSVLIGLLLFLIPAYFHLRQKLIRYTLSESKLEIHEGLISQTTRSIPIRRIQDVTVSATVLQRMLGFGTLSIDNASDDGGGKIDLANINTPRHYAEVLLKQMKRLDR